MDETNRAGAIVLSLLLMFFAVLVILLAWGAPDESIDSIANLSGYLNDHNTTSIQLLVTFGALIFLLLGLTIIIFELMPPQTGSVKVAKVGSGEARIGTDEITRRIEDELRSVPLLRGVEAHVSSRGTRAVVKLDLFVDTEADVAQAASEAMQRTRDIIETRMGVELESPPSAEVHYSDDGTGKRGPGTSATVAPQPPPRTSMAEAPSWRPAASMNPGPADGQTQQPTRPSAQPASTSEPIHEATSPVHEDRPSGA